MKKYGFTLIEMLGVFILLAFILMLAIPSLTGSLKKQKENSYNKFLNDLYLATEVYVHTQDMYDLSQVNNVIYIKIEDVVKANFLKSTLVNPSTKEKVNLQHYIKLTVNEDHHISYDYVENANIVESPYKESILNGADPIIKDHLIPVKITNNGTVIKADITQKWYQYAIKEWANAVILKDESITYDNNQVIPIDNIESYFVWIPKYSYQLWDLGEYNSYGKVDTSKVHAIPIKFGLTNTNDSNNNECTTPKVAGETGACKVGDYMTHPAFLEFNTNGFWVGKFETGYDGASTTVAAQVNNVEPSKIIIKPNAYSWRGINIGNAFKVSYKYKRNLESHMIKNTEWGAIAYLQHSNYGSAASVRKNNNSYYITGYAATEEPTGVVSNTSIEGNRFEGTTPGEDGTYTVNYFNPSSMVASTTANYTGIYDMSGGSWEYVMGASISENTDDKSEIITLYSDFFTSDGWRKYHDTYTSSIHSNYGNRILGDATGEMGPFQSTPYLTSWYNDYAVFADSNQYGWFHRGANYTYGLGAGIFSFGYYSGGSDAKDNAFRIVLSP